jgi:hypothetical protein
MQNGSRGKAANRDSATERAPTERRKFLKKAGKVAVTAPAVALLLSLDGRSAKGADGAPAPSGLGDVIIGPGLP